MKLFKMTCLNEDGDIETNGYFIDKINAEKAKIEMDIFPMNTRYNIKQNIVEIETED